MYHPPVCKFINLCQEPGNQVDLKENQIRSLEFGKEFATRAGSVVLQMLFEAHHH
jgi:hypothetical protein